jgi:uncharacterized membrane protein
MKTNRLEAFSDGVMAIIITIMVLEQSRPKQISRQIKSVYFTTKTVKNTLI